MARPIPSLPIRKLPFLPAPVATFFVLIVIFSIFSIITFLCGSHQAKKSQRRIQEKTVRLGGQTSFSKLHGNLSSKALLMAKMLSWRKVQDEEEEKDYDIDDEEVVWKRTIIMGERCRPLDFSGKILYDSDGNLLPSSPDPNHSNNLVSLAES